MPRTLLAAVVAFVPALSPLALAQATKPEAPPKAETSPDPKGRDSPASEGASRPAPETPSDDAKAVEKIPAELAPPVDQSPAEDPFLEGTDVQPNEMDELRTVEDATIDDGSQTTADLLRAASRLGTSNALGDRVREALGDLSHLPTDASAPPTVPDIFAGGVIDVDALQAKYDIPIELRPLVWVYVHFFQTDVREHFVKWLSRSTRYDAMMRATLKANGIPEDTIYLAMIESGFSPYAYSRARAAGPWQFIAGTAKRFGLKMDFWIDERRDPVKSTVAASRYLAELHRQFGDWHLAWAGYNAGGGRVARAIARERTRSFWDLAQGHVLKKETRHYVPKLIAAALISKQPEQFGFTESEISREAPLEFDEVSVTDAIDLELLARAANVSADDLRDLNPQLRRWCTPPVASTSPFQLRVPKGTGEKIQAALTDLPPAERFRFHRYVVEKGDTLSKIASSYGSAPEAIMHLNGLKDSRRLKLGSELMIPMPASAKNNAVVRGRLSASSRRHGFTAAPASEEVPAGPPPKPRSTLAGSVRLVPDDGKSKVVYGVAQGDSLWAIGQRFGVSADQLRQWNGLSRRRAALQVGRELTIYPPPGADLESLLKPVAP